MPRTVIHRRRRSPARKKREGMVLLIVLLILTMTTATATFAMHSTGYEIQAAGAMRQASRARNVAEGFAAALQVHLNEYNVCREEASLDASPGAAVTKYGYPEMVLRSEERVTSVTSADLTPGAAASSLLAQPIPDDAVLADGTRASPWTPSAWALVECREMRTSQAIAGNQDDSNLATGGIAPIAYRRRVTIFGHMAVDADSTSATAQRDDHESISISRFFMDKTE